jgi:NADPH-dependent curcumin reductase
VIFVTLVRERTMSQQQRQIVLASRPKGMPSDTDFRTEQAPIPPLLEGEILVKNEYLSIDPTIRGWIERDTYLPAVALGDVVRSTGLGEVVESRLEGFAPGDRVFGMVGWQEYSVHRASDRPFLVPAGIDPTDALSVFGVTGVTAYFGMLEVGRPREGETVVVSGAAGATGSIAGQIAKLKGCRVVGIAGSDTKCAWLREIGFDAAINYRTEDVGAALREHCPRGVHVFFDNVGGPILDAVLARLALRGRVVLCGAISQYNALSEPYGLKNVVNLIPVRGRMEAFIILDYVDRFPEAVMQLAGWLAEGKLQHRVHVLEGLEQAPEGLRKLFTGDHDGKVLVRIA